MPNIDTTGNPVGLFCAAVAIAALFEEIHDEST
jgi:hypothetical protein